MPNYKGWNDKLLLELCVCVGGCVFMYVRVRL